MSQMLPESGEVMSGAACEDVCRPPLTHLPRPTDNKELLRQQLLSAKERNSAERTPEIQKSKPQRNRQKNRWKLKFHHQALPQEYLDHYEQTQKKQNQNKPKQEKRPHYDLDNITNETFNIWTQRLNGVSHEPALTVPVTQTHVTPRVRNEDRRKRAPAIQPSKIVTYDDLPYMGEMTLNNSKPRRGRKPKKADICHLIYENYGTVVPGQPPPQIDNKLSQLSMCPAFRTPESTPKTDLQNKIISSLLGKKLCQENKRRLESCPPSLPSPHSPMPAAPLTIAGPLHNDDEPLNLCIRDLHELKIQIQKKFGNIYPSMPEVKSEPEDLESPRSEQPNAISVIQRTNAATPSTARSSPELSGRSRTVSPGGSEPGTPQCVYWPHSYLHPLALQSQLLYYQRLAGQLPYSPNDQDALSRSHSESPQSSPSVDESKNKLVLKQISELLDPNVANQVEEAKSPDLNKMKRSSPNPVQGPVKRKRSAIFIPPVPARSNSTTPTTEVSICKFKFTGGSKPSLQEKKMLSVDSGGNFRYYSGTGNNKGNKGYEYLQRDANQNRVHEPSVSNVQTNIANKDDCKKKRKSRKSVQREKLEQTFKEKGFLIQTQQLQSAEGATYCKFRQLRKFTRYLFRSWKDYLPGELDEKNKEDTNRIEESNEPVEDSKPVDVSSGNQWN